MILRNFGSFEMGVKEMRKGKKRQKKIKGMQVEMYREETKYDGMKSAIDKPDPATIIESPPRPKSNGAL